MTIGIRTLPVRGIKPVDKKALLDDSWMSGMKSGTALFLLIKKTRSTESHEGCLSLKRNSPPWLFVFEGLSR